MSKQIVSYCLAALLVNLMCVSSGVSASPTKSKEDQQIEKFKADIFELGTGPSARIKVKLRDKTTISGYVNEAGEDSFVIVDDKTGQPTRVVYPQVAQAKGRNSLTGKQVGYIVLIGLCVVLVIVGINAGRR